MPPTTQPNAIPPSLTDKDTRLLALAFLCSDSPKVNYTRLALAAGYKTSSSAYVCLGNVRKKAVGRGLVGGGAAVAARGEGAEMVGGKRGVEQEDGEDGVVGVKKKGKIADGGEDDGEGEGEVTKNGGREGDEG